jgi:hypothetical protein
LLDVRDLEAALTRLALRHARAFTTCPGGASCQALAPPPRLSRSAPARSRSDTVRGERTAGSPIRAGAP